MSHISRRRCLSGLVLAPLPLQAQDSAYIDFLFSPVRSGPPRTVTGENRIGERARVNASGCTAQTGREIS